MGIKERHLRQRASTRRAILDAARDLFVAEGYLHVSLRRVAERVEYSPAAIYGYFTGKDEIFFALASEGFERLHEMALRTPVPGDPLEALRHALWTFYEFSKAYPEYFALMFVDRSVPGIRDHYASNEDLQQMKLRLAGLVNRCVTAGVFPACVDGMSAFRVISAGLIGAAAARIFNRLVPGEDPDALARDVIELGIAGLRAGVPITFRAVIGSASPAADRVTS